MWELTLGYSMRGPVFFFWVGRLGGGIFSLFFFGGVVMPLGQAKNSDINTFGNKSSMQPMMAQHGLMRGPIFFLFCEGRGRNLLPFPPCSHQLFKFPSCSPIVPNSISLFIPVWFAQNSTLMYI